jgi:hypothetical protein
MESDVPSLRSAFCTGYPVGMMAEIRTPTVISKRSNVNIDHVDGNTVVTYTQEIWTEGSLPTAAVYRLMASADQGMVGRFSKAAIKNLPALPPQSTHWNGEPASTATE